MPLKVPRSDAPWLALLLVAFAATAYGPALTLPFIGDDYVFLDKTRDATFLGLWSLDNTDFDWYRPWSRELHFWAIQKIAGLHEVWFRVVGIMLWVVALCLYATILRRLASPRVAAIATLGVASLALWGTPLLWISGSQDLWMLGFAMASTLLFVAGRVGLALLPLCLALLSKETAAVLPILFGAYSILIERQRPTGALRRVGPFVLLTLAWLAIHPTLHTRLISGETTAEVEYRPPPLVAMAKTVLSTLNLDVFPRPQEVGWEIVLRTLASALLLAGGLALVTRRRPVVDRALTGDEKSARLALFAAAWTAIGWFPLFLPSIGWHAYYGCLGTLGAWLLLAHWLQFRPRIAVVVIMGLAILRGARANTLTWDWGTESYQRRAGSILSAIRSELYRQHPTLPRHSRVFLAHIPNNIGLIAGQSPAIRVWYRDSTLQAGFYSYYRPRSASAPRGDDLFFRFDSAVGMVEVKAGSEDVRLGPQSNANWEADHEVLAVLFLRSGDASRAAFEFEKLSALPHRPDAALYASVCWEFVGDTIRADSLLARARTRMELPQAQLDEWVERLRTSLPDQQQDGYPPTPAPPARPSPARRSRTASRRRSDPSREQARAAARP